MTTATETITPIELAQFTGSETLTRWSMLTRSVLTEGCVFVAERAGAYWLFDAIDSHLTTRGVTDETEFVVARLRVDLAARTAELTLDDGNGLIWMTQTIPFTDFQLPELETYAVFNGQAWTHMLPSEY